jgi:hypothetical protein
MTGLCQVERKFMVARATGLVQGDKRLMDEENVHGLQYTMNASRLPKF